MFYGISFADMGPGRDQGGQWAPGRSESGESRDTSHLSSVSVAQVLVLPTVVLHQLNTGEYREHFFENIC